ncbi:MAG: DUF58 domain-containing protein [Planctomycetota bacterium]
MPSNILDPDVLAKVGRLDLQAKFIVEGFLSGMHRSPFKGISVEFAQHRGYVPGDDLKHIDWKVWGKSERYYIKQYEAETNLVCTIVVDTSTSMRYVGDKAHNRLSKGAWAKLAAAALSYLVLSQSDAVALATFSDGLDEWLPKSSNRNNLHRICDILEKAPEKQRTSIGDALQTVAERMPRRGIVMVFSDLFDDVNTLLKGLQRLRHTGHEVVVVQILDPDELDIPFEGMIQFKGLEGTDMALCHPRSIKKAYQEEVHKHLTAVKAACRRNNIDFVSADTRTAVDMVLTAYMAHREHAAQSGAR